MLVWILAWMTQNTKEKAIIKSSKSANLFGSITWERHPSLKETNTSATKETHTSQEHQPQIWGRQRTPTTKFKSSEIIFYFEYTFLGSLFCIASSSFQTEQRICQFLLWFGPLYTPLSSMREGSDCAKNQNV